MCDTLPAMEALPLETVVAVPPTPFLPVASGMPVSSAASASPVGVAEATVT